MSGGINRVAVKERLREARDSVGLTQDELAELVGVHIGTIKEWENVNRQSLPFKKLDEVTRALGVSRDWLLYGNDRDDQRVFQEGVQQVLAALGDAVTHLDRRLDELERRLDDAG